MSTDGFKRSDLLRILDDLPEESLLQIYEFARLLRSNENSKDNGNGQSPDRTLSGLPIVTSRDAETWHGLIDRDGTDELPRPPAALA